MTNFGGEHLSVAKALYQLEFYLQQLNIQLTVKDLYSLAYKERRGDKFDDGWLSVLDENPDVVHSIEEPFTTQNIIETLMRTGHEPLVRALMREIRHHKIGFSQLYMIGSSRRH
jgi:hypothetical protein